MEDVLVLSPLNHGTVTQLAHVVTCQCGSTSMEVKKQTATSVKLECRKCGTINNVKGYVSMIRVSAEEITYAVENKVVGPIPKTEKAEEQKDEKEKVFCNDNDKKERFENLRFGITTHGREVVNTALEMIRIHYFDNPNFKGKLWQGYALELLAADYIAGVPDPVRKVHAIIEDETKSIIDDAERNGLKGKITQRKIRDTRAVMRGKLFEEYGLNTTDRIEYEFPKPTEYKAPEKTQEEQRSEREYKEATEAKEMEQKADDRIVDDGKLKSSVTMAISEYIYELGEDGIRPKTLNGDASHLDEMKKKWESSGGYLFKIYGDERTRTKTNATPVFYFWCVGEVERFPEFQNYYSIEMFDVIKNARLKIVELVPVGYENLGDDEQWDKPSIAEEREGLHG